MKRLLRCAAPQPKLFARHPHRMPMASLALALALAPAPAPARLSRLPPARRRSPGSIAPRDISFRLHYHSPKPLAGGRTGPVMAPAAVSSSSSFSLAALTAAPTSTTLMLERVSVDSLQYESGYLGGISEKTKPSPAEAADGVQNGVLNPMEYLTNILSSRVYDVAIESPLQLAPKLSARLGVDLWLKREDLQPVIVFSFKLRGAYNMMVKLTKEQLDGGVICSSAGNHAQGVALAAQRLGCDAVIVMPVTTPEIKVPKFNHSLQVKVIGVEPSDANAMALSLYHGQRIMLEQVGGFADGVAVKVVGEETFCLCRELVDGVVLVSRDATCASIKVKLYPLSFSIVGVHTDSELAAMMGGRSNVEDELLCRFVFPEKPGALMKFLDSFSPRWNISLFHYRAQGETGANVLVGIQVPKEDTEEFKNRAENLGYEYAYEMNNAAYRLLMQ
ncbi:hypothetical protein BHM03_00054796 [Ensete ventricosum]|nr:hypothetical protein BHM03_00054796 [Ensete ventricosum]